MIDFEESEKSNCPNCGAERHPKGSFCTQCGALIPVIGDNASTAGATAVPASGQGSDSPDPEQLWWAGFDLSKEAREFALQDRYDEYEELMQGAMSLWNQALEMGVQGKSQVSCHWFLGNELYDRALDKEEQYRLSTEPLDQILTLSKAVTHLERAVEFDSRIENFIFGDKQNQADLLKLDLVWGSQALYIKDQQGMEAAINYVVSKIKVTQHLLVVLPNLFYSFGSIYAAAGSVADAMDMFRVASNAEDYGDVIDHEDWRYRTAQIAKQNAAKNLRYLEVHGHAPS